MSICVVMDLTSWVEASRHVCSCRDGSLPWAGFLSFPSEHQIPSFS